jgi:hypothetical protein
MIIPRIWTLPLNSRQVRQVQGPNLIGSLTFRPTAMGIHRYSTWIDTVSNFSDPKGLQESYVMWWEPRETDVQVEVAKRRRTVVGGGKINFVWMVLLIMITTFTIHVHAYAFSIWDCRINLESRRRGAVTKTATWQRPVSWTTCQF